MFHRRQGQDGALRKIVASVRGLEGYQSIPDFGEGMTWSDVTVETGEEKELLHEDVARELSEARLINWCRHTTRLHAIRSNSGTSSF